MPKPVDVDAALDERAHPLRSQIDELRALVRGVDAGIAEQWKWNAPSFSVGGVYLLTLMLRDDDRVLIVVHHPAAPEIASALLTGDHADGRRMVELRGPDALAEHAAELRRVVAELVARTP